MIMSSKKRTSVSLETKVKIIHDLKNGKKQKDLMRTYELSQSTIATFWQHREKILSAYQNNTVDITRKRLRTAANSDVETAVLKWFNEVRDKNIPISGEMMRSKAKDFAFLLNVENFAASNGWLSRFKQRHGISCRMISGEEKSVDSDCVASWKENNIPLIFEEFQPKNVFNADETGLFYQLLPNKTLSVKGEKCSGGKMSKMRITVLCCCNMDGTEKEKLLVIGKSEKPRCFKNVVRLPVAYCANKKSWMTTKLFTDWLLKFDAKMSKENREVLLLLDNATSHRCDVRLQAVTLRFLPPNTTSKLQPLDQGVIHSLKAHYRKRMIPRILINLRNDKSPKLDLHSAIEIIAAAWEYDVTSTTINNCWKKAGFRHPENAVPAVTDGDAACDNFDESADLYRELCSELQVTDESDEEEHVVFEDFVNADNDLFVSEPLTDAEIVSEIAASKEGIDASEVGTDESDPEEEVSISVPQVNASMALEALKQVKSYFSNSVPREMPACVKKLLDIEHVLEREIIFSSKQKKITDYF